MVRETSLHLSDLIAPLFVGEGEKVREEMENLPGICRYSVDTVTEEAKILEDLGIPAVLLFGVSTRRDPVGSSAWEREGIVQRAISAIKRATSLIVITDICLCGYADHGHCGVMCEGRVDNDRTVEAIARVALSHAREGVDGVAPSDMMDGRVGVMRRTLDEAGFHEVFIMSYSVKYASSLYGPFREMMHSTPRFGDRRSYQMDPGNAREAIREVALDLSEGADIVMVKPALAYLDIVARVREHFLVPLAVYNVSGEYAMVKSLARMGFAEERELVTEVLLSLKRAGADLIVTYHAKEMARWLTTR